MHQGQFQRRRRPLPLQPPVEHLAAGCDVHRLSEQQALTVSEAPLVVPPPRLDLAGIRPRQVFVIVHADTPCGRLVVRFVLEIFGFLGFHVVLGQIQSGNEGERLGRRTGERRAAHLLDQPGQIGGIAGCSGSGCDGVQLTVLPGHCVEQFARIGGTHRARQQLQRCAHER